MSLTAEQLEARRHRIGASDVAAICGLSKWRTAFDVFIEKTQGIYQPAGDAAALGSRLEPAILDWAEQDYGLGTLLRSLESRSEAGLDFPMVVSLDAMTTDGCRPVNAKTAGLTGGSVEEWGEAETDQIPEEYKLQEQAEMLATGADVAFVPALIARRGFVMFRVNRDEEMIGYIKEICGKFWCDYVMTKTPPPVEQAPSEYVLRHMERVPDSCIDLDEEAVIMWEHKERLNSEKLDAEKRAKDWHNRLVAMLGTAEAGRLPDGRIITFKTTRRNMPAKEAHVQEFRQLRITKG